MIYQIYLINNYGSRFTFELQSLIFNRSIDLLYNELFINKSIHKLIHNIYLLSIRRSSILFIINFIF